MRTRLACSIPYFGLRDATHKLYKREVGLRAFYNGYSAALMNTLPEAGLSMLIDHFKLKIFLNLLRLKKFRYK